MSPFSLTHLADPDLLADLHDLVRQDRTTTARLLAHLAEVEARQLYLPAAYPSLYAYCMGELKMSEDMAWRRTTVASLARRYPAIFPAIAEGRLTLSTVLLLASRPLPEAAAELLEAAAGKSKRQVEKLLAERFPQPDVPTVLKPIAPPAASPAPVAGEAQVHAAQCSAEQELPALSLVGSGTPDPPAPARVVPSNPSESRASMVPLAPPAAPRPNLAPLSPGRYALQVTVDQATHDLLREAQALLAHTVSSCDVASVLERALREMVERLRKQKFATCSAPRPQRRSARGRHIPAAVKREVCKRDEGRCTFLSASGTRCEERHPLEYDHATPVARGGETTAANLRLRCRAHNQHAAEQAYGADFMRAKRERARRLVQGRESAGRRGRASGGIGPAVPAVGVT